MLPSVCEMVCLFCLTTKGTWVFRSGLLMDQKQAATLKLRHQPVLEQIAECQTAVFDKPGTLIYGS
jgi:hypothetical protein